MLLNLRAIFGLQTPQHSRSRGGSWLWSGVAALLMAISLMVFVEEALADATIATRTAGVRLFDKPNLKSNVLASLDDGVQLTGLEKKGLFWKVRLADGATGFVMITQVDSGTEGTGLRLQSAMRSLLKQRRGDGDAEESVRLRAKNAVMGIRGLDAGDLSEVGNLRPNYRDLEMLESLEVPQQAVDKLASDVLTESMTRSGT